MQEEPEYHGDSSSATATPEPVSKRQGKPSNNDQYAKVIKSEAPVVDQVTEEKEEELGTKKVKKMVIEEVEVNIKELNFPRLKPFQLKNNSINFEIIFDYFQMPVISNEVTQMTGLAEQPISAQENPSGMSNIGQVFNFLNIDVNGIFFLHLLRILKLLMTCVYV